MFSPLGIGDDRDDRDGWVFRDEDRATPYLGAGPISAGLVSCRVRLDVPQEGPRASLEPIRGSRFQVAEPIVETSGWHGRCCAQVQGQVIRATDDEVPAAAAFLLTMPRVIEGRSVPGADGAA